MLEVIIIIFLVIASMGWVHGLIVGLIVDFIVLAEDIDVVLSG